MFLILVLALLGNRASFATPCIQWQRGVKDYNSVAGTCLQKRSRRNCQQSIEMPAALRVFYLLWQANTQEGVVQRHTRGQGWGKNATSIRQSLYIYAERAVHEQPQVKCGNPDV